MPLLSSISILIMLRCSTIPAFSAVAAKPTFCKYHYYQESTEVDGHSITTEYYVPDGRGSHPLVFMLHGSAGAFSLRSNDEPPRDNFGEKTLARSCFVAVLPHYLEAIGLKSLTSEREIISLFPVLLAATDTMLSKAESVPSTWKKPVFLFGESLGGYLCIALALKRREIAAVSEYSGGLPPGYALHRQGVPNVLISHGDADTLVSVSEADALYRYLGDHGIPAVIDLYPGEGHYLSIEAQRHILSRTIEFFRRTPKKGLDERQCRPARPGSDSGRTGTHF
jgi:acetyl esterase/lipase